MELLNITINLEEFFNLNLIIFITISFLFSVIITAVLVFLLAPFQNKVREAKKLPKEDYSKAYLKFIVYVLAEFVSFIADIFLVIFSKSYDRPWFSIITFVTILLYKLIFVLLKGFRDLGFNSKGLISSIQLAKAVIVDKDLSKVEELIDDSSTNTNKNEK